MSDNHTVYQTTEFAKWAYAPVHLMNQEAYLFNTYFEKDRRTLEVGTASGRVLIALQKLGYTDLHGCDFVPEYIEVAKQRKDIEPGSIEFQVQDATELTYADESFDQLIYVGQVISAIENAEARKRAFPEMYRVCRPGGTVIVSVLFYDARMRSIGHRVFALWLRLVRALTGNKESTQYLPWMRQGGKLNLAALVDRSARNYWFRGAEIWGELESVGFKVIGCGTKPQIEARQLYTNVDGLTRQELSTVLYLVCKKTGTA